MNKQTNMNQIKLQSLSREISDKSIVIANLQANLYETMQENSKIKKKLKDQSKNEK